MPPASPPAPAQVREASEASAVPPAHGQHLAELVVRDADRGAARGGVPSIPHSATSKSPQAGLVELENAICTRTRRPAGPPRVRLGDLDVEADDPVGSRVRLDVGAPPSASPPGGAPPDWARRPRSGRIRIRAGSTSRATSHSPQSPCWTTTSGGSRAVLRDDHESQLPSRAIRGSRRRGGSFPSAERNAAPTSISSRGTSPEAHSARPRKPDTRCGRRRATWGCSPRRSSSGRTRGSTDWSGQSWNVRSRSIQATAAVGRKGLPTSMAGVAATPGVRRSRRRGNETSSPVLESAA